MGLAPLVGGALLLGALLGGPACEERALDEGSAAQGSAPGEDFAARRLQVQDLNRLKAAWAAGAGARRDHVARALLERFDVTDWTRTEVEQWLGAPDEVLHRLEYAVGRSTPETNAPLLLVALEGGRVASMAGSALWADGREPFDAGRWPTAADSLRQRMARELFQSGAWDGLAREEVLARLGPPTLERRELLYVTEPATSYDSDARWLVFELEAMGPEGRVMRATH